MQILRPVGRQASSRKYDLITALGVHACRGDKHFQRLVLRFITAIVARYNWQADELSIGQRELAALWSVDERTVKRELAKLRALGWLVQKRAAVRGRVAIHGLDIAAILSATGGVLAQPVANRVAIAAVAVNSEAVKTRRVCMVSPGG